VYQQEAQLLQRLRASAVITLFIVIQGHILIPIESLYATSYQWITTLTCDRAVLVKLSFLTSGCLSLTHLYR